MVITHSTWRGRKSENSMIPLLLQLLSLLISLYTNNCKSDFPHKLKDKKVMANK